MEGRSLRRIAGLLAARLPEAGLERVADPRRGRSKWALAGLLRGVLVGLMAGCRSLREVEVLAGEVSPAVRRRLKLPGRLADTTLRDVLCRLPWQDVRACLHRGVRAAARRGALGPQRGLPWGVVSLDGKVTALPVWDDAYVQKHQPEVGAPYGLVRTVTATLVSAAGRPCIDVTPVPAATNEMGHFQTAFGEVLQRHGSLFKVVTYDAGALSEENARRVVEAGKHYLFSLKGSQRTQVKLAAELLSFEAVVAQTQDVLDNRTCVTRRLKLLRCQQSWAYGEGKGPAESVWQHARTFLCVESFTEKDGVVEALESRLYVTSLPDGALTPEGWLRLVRLHWGVETTHQALDVAFQEDARPWIVADGTGCLAVLVLRRLAYTLLTLFRSVTSRSDAARALRWGDLLRRVWVALVAAGNEHLQRLRPRRLDTVRG